MQTQPPHSIAIDKLTTEGRLFTRLDENRVECHACGHRCRIPEGRRGICQVRFNDSGVLRVPYGYFSSIQVDPVEKKPFYHALPGSRAMSFGMLGCDYHCGYCQNWITSQAVRDPRSRMIYEPGSAEAFIGLALENGCRIVTSTYNEPLITSEWAVEIFRQARAHGLVTSYVSNGNATPEVIEYLAPWIDCYKIDLKGFRDAPYRALGGVLQRVLDSMVMIHARGIWMEIVTLLVPGMNDSEAELRDIASFIAGISPDIPWHVTAFHPDYVMQNIGRTPVESILSAVMIGKECGLRYVYAGNIPGRAGQWENTVCHSCRQVLIERTGFSVKHNGLNNGTCPRCSTAIAGFWEAGNGRSSQSYQVRR